MESGKRGQITPALGSGSSGMDITENAPEHSWPVTINPCKEIVADIHDQSNRRDYEKKEFKKYMKIIEEKDKQYIESKNPPKRLILEKLKKFFT